jgi:hypothetical protein
MYLIFVSKCLPNQFGGSRQVPTHLHLHFYPFKKTKFKRGRQEPTRFACISNHKKLRRIWHVPSPPLYISMSLKEIERRWAYSYPSFPSPPLPCSPPLASSSLFLKLKGVDIYLTFLHAYALIKFWKMVGICLLPHPILHLNAF